jgi:uncharacterized protein
MDNLTPKEKEQLSQLIQEAVKKPPTIGLVGVSGVGKSSTINSMFKTNLPISHTKACTKEFRQVPLELKMNSGPAEGQNVQLVVCDAPGLGEDEKKDPEYLDMYHQNLPTCDMILWVMSARNRAIALDQRYLREFPELHERIVFGASQVDLLEPLNWKSGLPIPSREQEAHISEIIIDRSQRLSDTLGRKIEIIPYSSSRGYNLETLFTSLLQSCSGNRSWIFGALKNFSYKDFISVETSEQLKSRGSMRQENGGARREENQIIPNIVDQAKQQFKQAFSWFNLPAESQESIQKIVGRNDIDRRPLNEDEINLVQSWIVEEKKNSIRGKNTKN